MILYFSGTGNSLAIGRHLAEQSGDRLLSLGEAVNRDLTAESRIGLVFPCYWFNAPEAVVELVQQLRLPHKAYTFVVITCGAQAGIAIWKVRRLLAKKGVALDYSNKIRVPDNSAVGFGRNPNDQAWKFDKFAPRLERIVSDVSTGKRALHYACWGAIGALCALPAFQRRILPLLTPVVNAEQCVGCGICEKVCPRRNILLTENKAQLGDRCTHCLACLHFCPQQAIAIAGKTTPKTHQYHHPQVTLKDMVVQEQA